jgi:hypothetical protein
MFLIDIKINLYIFRANLIIEISNGQIKIRSRFFSGFFPNIIIGMYN